MTAIGRERQAGVQGIASACIVGGMGTLQFGRALPAWRRRGRFISIMSTSAAIIGIALFSRWGNVKSEISPMMRLEQAIQENA